MNVAVSQAYRIVLQDMKVQQLVALAAMNDAYDRFVAGHLDDLEERDPMRLGDLEREYLAAHGEWVACDIAYRKALHDYSC